MKPRYSSLSTLAGIFICVSGLQAQETYHVTRLPSLGLDLATPTFTYTGAGTSAYGINDSGHLVGAIEGSIGVSYSGANSQRIPQVYSTPGMSQTSLAWDVNNSGLVVGHGGQKYFDGSPVSGQYHHGFTYDSAGPTMNDSGTLPGGYESRLFAVNHSGVAAGWSQQLDGSILRTQAGTFVGGVWTNVHNAVKLSGTDAQSAIFAISDNGNLAGFSLSSTGNQQAFRSNGVTSVALGNFGGNQSVALGINDSVTVGWAENISGRRQAFLHNGSTLTNLDSTFSGNLSFASHSAATAVNDSGIIVGNAWDGFDNHPNPDGSRPIYNSRGFVSNGTQTFTLSDHLNTTAGWKIESASDINASGQIAATARATSAFSQENAVILTAENAWTASGNGAWNDGANWQKGSSPDIQGAAYLNLAEGVTVSGPATPETLFALTLGKTGNFGTLALQSGGPLYVTGDIELRNGATIDATASSLSTSYLHGTGSVMGTLQAGIIHTGAGETLSLQGNVSSARVEIGATGVVKVAGTLQAAILGYRNYSQPGRGTIELTGNSQLGGNAISSIVSIGTLNTAGHTATLLTSDLRPHVVDSVELAIGGTLVAANGIRTTDRISGSGTINGNVIADSAYLHPGSGNSLTINGNLSGSGLIVGSNVTVTGAITPGGYANFLPSGNIGSENATTFGTGPVRLGGTLQMSGGTITAANGLSLTAVNYWDSFPRGQITGHGTIAGRVLGGGIINATGNLTLGHAAAADGIAMRGYYDYGMIHAGSHTVTLLDSNHAEVDGVTLAGGSVIAANGISLTSINGHGNIAAAVSNSNSSSYGIVNATGNLALGDSASTSGVDFHGRLNVGSHTVTLRDADFAKIGSNLYSHSTNSYSIPAITITGGTIVAANGLQLQTGGGIFASGTAATSTIQGDLKLDNSIVEAASGNTLAINGTLSGHGVLLGNITATTINATAGNVVLDNSLEVGSRIMTVLAQTRAQLGQTTTLAGGSMGASNGIGLGFARAITGHGTISPGLGQSLLVENGVIEATSGQSLAINGNLEGRGVVVGNVSVTGTNAMAISPTGQVNLIRNLDVGNRNAVFHSNAVAQINSRVTLAGGSLTSANGFQNSGLVTGNGSFSSNVALVNGIIDGVSGGGIHINGTLSGHGITIGTVTANSNALGSPNGIVSLYNTVNIDNRDATLHTNGKSYLSSLASQGGSLNTGGHGATIHDYSGHGTLNGNVTMDGGVFVVDVGQTLNITGTLTGYGIVVGSHNKSIITPTGTVNYTNPWSVGSRSDITVYSLGVPKAAEVSLAPGSRVFSAQGWEFANLKGSGTIAGNVTISTILSPGFSPGTIQFENDLTLAMASTTVLEFAGTGAGFFDFLDVDGNLTLGGRLRVDFLSGFDPATGLLPEWFSSQSLAGAFSHISWTGLGVGKGVTFDASTGRLGISTVPEPSALALLLPAAAGSVLRRRRK